MIEMKVVGRAEGGAIRWACVPEEICLGAAGSSGMEKIRVSLPAAWDGMTVRMTFLPYRKPAVAVLVRDGKEVEITGNMTCGRGGRGEIVFDAVTDGKVTYTAAGAGFTVYGHAAAGGEDPGYTPDEWQQFVAQVEDAAKQAEEAKEQAAEAKNQAEEAKEQADKAKSQAQEAASRAAQSSVEATKAADYARICADAASEATRRAEEAAANFSVDQQVIEGSKNAVAGGAVKAYVDEQMGAVQTALERILYGGDGA